MLADLMNTYTEQIASIQFILLFVNVVLHIIFAGAVAKDTGILAKQGIHTLLVSPIVWAFATLVGGVFIAVIYWFMHHSTLTRPSYKE
jgi:undecaprenyl pyrophosphate phosphatase UppP